MRQPPAGREAVAVGFARSHLKALAATARELEEDDCGARTVEIRVTTAPAGPASSNGPEARFYVLEGDWFRQVCDDPFARVLGEAASSLAALPLLGPLRAEAAGPASRDPYAPAFELWRHGLELRWAEPEYASLHLPLMAR